MGRSSICTEFSSIYPTFKKTKRAQLLVKSFSLYFVFSNFYFVIIRQQKTPFFEVLSAAGRPNFRVFQALNKRPSRTLQIGACYIYFQHLCRTKATTPFGIVAYRNDFAIWLTALLLRVSEA